MFEFGPLLTWNLGVNATVHENNTLKKNVK